MQLSMYLLSKAPVRTVKYRLVVQISILSCICNVIITKFVSFTCVGTLQLVAICMLLVIGLHFIN